MTRRDVLIQYLQSCVEIADWHGVSDAANDLRELEAEDRGAKRWTRDAAKAD